jgi:hypothetical protein
MACWVGCSFVHVCADLMVKVSSGVCDRAWNEMESSSPSEPAQESSFICFVPCPCLRSKLIAVLKFGFNLKNKNSKLHGEAIFFYIF